MCEHNSELVFGVKLVDIYCILGEIALRELTHRTKTIVVLFYDGVVVSDKGVASGADTIEFVSKRIEFFCERFERTLFLLEGAFGLAKILEDRFWGTPSIIPFCHLTVVVSKRPLICNHARLVLLFECSKLADESLILLRYRLTHPFLCRKVLTEFCFQICVFLAFIENKIYRKCSVFIIYKQFGIEGTLPHCLRILKDAADLFSARTKAVIDFSNVVVHWCSAGSIDVAIPKTTPEECGNEEQYEYAEPHRGKYSKCKPPGALRPGVFSSSFIYTTTTPPFSLLHASPQASPCG